MFYTLPKKIYFDDNKVDFYYLNNEEKFCYGVGNWDNSNEFHFYIRDYTEKYYFILLISKKLTRKDFYKDINYIDIKMLETLGYWLDDLKLNLDNIKENIYLYIRLKASNNKEFFNWWQYYNFQIRIL